MGTYRDLLLVVVSGRREEDDVFSYHLLDVVLDHLSVECGRLIN